MQLCVSEDYPALAMHYMPDPTHQPSLKCWCNPRPLNHQSRGSTIFEHTSYAKPKYMAGKDV